MLEPVLLDLFCGAGGCAMGYHRAGFRVVGVDNRKQPHFPFQFVQVDALEYLRECGHCFDAIHASPPCQFGSLCTPMQHRAKHPNLIPATQELLRASGKPYVIENVGGNRRLLRNPVMLCGSMFGLQTFRHRWFEVWPVYILTPQCRHNFRPLMVTTAGSHSRAIRRDEAKTVKHAPAAYGIDWMTHDELTQAIPPAYTEFIGRQLLAHLNEPIAETESGGEMMDRTRRQAVAAVWPETVGGEYTP